MKKVILIDDEDLIHLMWQKEARKSNIELICFTEPKEFFKSASEYDKEVLIFIDSNLGLEVTGEVYAKNIFDLGFENIYLTSAYTEIKLEDYPYLKGIVDKRVNLEKF